MQVSISDFAQIMWDSFFYVSELMLYSLLLIVRLHFAIRRMVYTLFSLGEQEKYKVFFTFKYMYGKQ
jgi:hypothetical protein